MAAKNNILALACFGVAAYFFLFDKEEEEEAAVPGDGGVPPVYSGGYVDAPDYEGDTNEGTFWEDYVQATGSVAVAYKRLKMPDTIAAANRMEYYEYEFLKYYTDHYFIIGVDKFRDLGPGVLITNSGGLQVDLYNFLRGLESKYGVKIIVPKNSA